jgi:hypothetical protein
MQTPNIDHYAAFYFLGVFEFHKLWDRKAYSIQHVLQYRGFIWNLMISDKYSEPFLRNKIVKLVTDLARHEFPQYWPTYINDLTNLQYVSIPIALNALKTTSEEFLGNRQGISSNHCNMLKQEFINNLPQINKIIFQILQTGLVIANGGTMNLQIHPIIQFEKGMEFNPSPVSANTVSATEMESNINVCFEILQNILASIPDHNEYWNPRFLEIVLNYTSLNSMESDLVIHPIDYLTELFSRPSLSAEASKLVPTIMKKTNGFIKRLLSAYGTDMEYMIPDQYLELIRIITKLLDLMTYIFSSHLDSSTSADINEVTDSISLICQIITFPSQIISMDELISSVDIIQIIADQMVAKHLDSPINQIILQIIDRLSTDQRFLINGEYDINSKVMELQATMAQKFPVEILEMCLGRYYTGLNSIQNIFTCGWNIHMIPVLSELSSTIVNMGRLNDLLDGSFEQRFDVGLNLVVSHIQAIQLMKTNIPFPDEHFYHLLDKFFESLSLRNNWISIYQEKAMKIHKSEDVHKIINDLIEVTCTTMDRLPEKHKIAPSRLLATISLILKPDLLRNPNIQVVLNQLISKSFEFDSVVMHNLWKLATNCFIYFPFLKVPKAADWGQRSLEFQNYIAPIREPIEQVQKHGMQNIDNPQLFKTHLLLTFDILKSICGAVNNGSVQSREVVYQAIFSVIPVITNLFGFFQNNLDVLAVIVDLLAMLTNVFKKQISKSNFKESIPKTLSLCQEYILQVTIDTHSEELELNCFNYFAVLIEDQSNLFDGVVPNMIEFCSIISLKHLVISD